MMKLMVGAAALALTMSTASAAVTTNSQITVPSALNSGAGIAGLPGLEDGPVVRPGMAGQSAAAKHSNLAVAEQDPSDIRGLRGDEDGRAPLQPTRGGL